MPGRNQLWRRGVCILLAIGMISSPAFSQTVSAQTDFLEEIPQMVKVAEASGEMLGLTEADQVDPNLFTYQSPLIGTTPGVYKAAEEQPAVVVGSNLVNVRSDAGTSYNQVARLVRYQPITILGEKTVNSNTENPVIWYHIGFTRNGVYEEGYMHSTYVMKTTPLVEGDSSDEAFEEAIAEFPDSYKPTLRSLHKMFPDWIFEPVLTGLSWEDVVAEEYALKRNLVPDSSAFSWKSVRDGDYDWDSNTWISHDGQWVGASKAAIAYYLDPRNFLTADCRITQFETLSYEEGVQNKSGLEAILAGSFMADHTEYDYYEYFLKAAQEANVSPYLLASRCLQEVGREGSSTTSGKYPGYEGYYNFFNIGASAGADGSGAVENALKYAREKGWDSPEKSIIGGAKFLGANYIAKGQNTFYFQKFNVVNEEGLYSHQYMQNLSAASTEGASYQKIYKDWENAAIEYRVPVYEDMPEEPAPLPIGLTNDYKTLSALKVNGKEVEGFDGEKTSYELFLTFGLTDFWASCSMKAAHVTVPNAVCFTTGTFEKEIVVTAEDGSSQSYLLHITVEEGKKGDADGDGNITTDDAFTILMTIVGNYKQEGNGISALDADQDGDVTTDDAFAILRYIVGSN